MADPTDDWTLLQEEAVPPEQDGNEPEPLSTSRELESVSRAIPAIPRSGVSPAASGIANTLDFNALSLASDASWYRQEHRPEELLRSFLTFRLTDAIYGIDLVRLREIIKARTPTEVPRTPPFIAGIISVRGLVMPVLDLRVRLSLPGRYREATRCLVVARGDERFGLLVDQVLQVVTLAPSEIESTPALARTVGEELDGGRRRDVDPEDPEGDALEEVRGDGDDSSRMRGAEYITGIGRAADAPEELILLLDLDAVVRFEIRRRRGERSS